MIRNFRYIQQEVYPQMEAQEPSENRVENPTKACRIFVFRQLTYYYWLGFLSLYSVTVLVLKNSDQRISPDQDSVNENFAPRLSDPCNGKRIYMYSLPPRFNSLLLQNCNRKLADWVNFCPHVENQGFGQLLSSNNVSGWFRTDPYMLEVIFHSRMQAYSCLTQSRLEADAFFIPYYSGLDALRFLYGKDIGKAADQGQELLSWLDEEGGVTWKRRWGEDHFIVMGRTAWDFSRQLETKEGWGTSFHVLPAMANVTALFLEKRPWPSINEQAIPYPTSFHPPSFSTFQNWLYSVRVHPRRFLFSYSGAPRCGRIGSIRQKIVNQCKNSHSRCAFVDCQKVKCAHNPQPVMDSFLQSDFCLQPPGDSATRRSTFDGLIAGCIPVFFRNDSAYSQYTWHLPKDPDQYSVFIPEEALHSGLIIQEFLESYSRERIIRMRDNIIKLIPGLIYLSPAAAAEFENSGATVRDAFLISLEGILGKADARRRTWALTSS